MVATVKCDTITEASNTGTANLSLSSTGNVTIGNNLTVNGTTTQTGSTTFTGPTYFPDGSVSAPSIAHTGDTNCGLYFGTDTIYAATAGTKALTIDASQNVSVTNTLAMGSSFLRNRLINGNMVIDQRNAGASVTPTTSGYYSCDRWTPQLTQASKFSVQQTPSATETGYATRVNAGYTNYLAQTVVAAYSVGAGDYFGTEQRIEGYNVSDLAYGSSGAKTVTVSFWAYSNTTGTYPFSLYTGGASYVTTYSISVANTWEYKTITVPGSTAYALGSTTNGSGLYVRFTFTAGSNFSTASTGQWISGNYATTSGCVNWINTSSATLYFTGVQFEVGSVATAFERRQYGTELVLCQRYYQKSYNVTTVPGTATTAGTSQMELQGAGSYTVMYSPCFFKVSMRADPTVTLYDDNGNSGKLSTNTGSQNAATQNVNTHGFSGGFGVGTASVWLRYQFTAAIEL